MSITDRELALRMAEYEALIAGGTAAPVSEAELPAAMADYEQGVLGWPEPGTSYQPPVDLPHDAQSPVEQAEREQLDRAKFRYSVGNEPWIPAGEPQQRPDATGMTPRLEDQGLGVGGAGVLAPASESGVSELQADYFAREGKPGGWKKGRTLSPIEAFRESHRQHRFNEATRKKPLWETHEQSQPGEDLDASEQAWLADFAKRSAVGGRVTTPGNEKIAVREFRKTFGRDMTAAEGRALGEFQKIYARAYEIVTHPMDRAGAIAAARYTFRYRRALLGAVQELAPEHGPFKDLAAVQRFARATWRGTGSAMSNVDRTLRMALGLNDLRDEDASFVATLVAAREAGDPLAPDSLPWYVEWPTVAAEMGPPMGAGIVATAAGTAAAGPVGGLAAGSAFWGTQIFPDEYVNLREAGASPTEAAIAGGVSALLQGAVENIKVNPFKGPAKQAINRSLWRFTKEAVKSYGSELSEEAIQAVISAMVEQMVGDMDAEDGKAFRAAIEAMRESAGPLLVMMAPGAMVSGTREVRDYRRELRLKDKAVQGAIKGLIAEGRAIREPSEAWQPPSEKPPLTKPPRSDAGVGTDDGGEQVQRFTREELLTPEGARRLAETNPQQAETIAAVDAPSRKDVGTIRVTGEPLTLADRKRLAGLLRSESRKPKTEKRKAPEPPVGAPVEPVAVDEQRPASIEGMSDAELDDYLGGAIAADLGVEMPGLEVGTTEPAPAAGEVAKQPWEMTKGEFEAERPAVPGYLYHGSPEGEITTESLDPYYHTSPWKEGIGFYATEDRDVAAGYAAGRTAKKDRKADAVSKGRVLYVKSSAKSVLDMDAPYDPKVWDKFLRSNNLDQELLEFYNDGPLRSNTEAMRAAKRGIEEDQIGGGEDATYTIDEFLRDNFDATVHAEGKRGDRPHRVTIFKGDIQSRGKKGGAAYGTSRLGIVPPSKVHEGVVRRAAAAGKPVPANVLAEYPDIKPPSSSAKPTAPKPVATPPGAPGRGLQGSQAPRLADKRDAAKAREGLAAKRVEVDAELSDAFGAIAKHLDGKAFSGVDPELVKLTAKALRVMARKGVVEFADAVLAIAENLPDHIDKMHGAIEAGWKALGRLDTRISGVGSVSEVLLKRRPETDAGQTRKPDETQGDDEGSAGLRPDGVAPLAEASADLHEGPRAAGGVSGGDSPGAGGGGGHVQPATRGDGQRDDGGGSGGAGVDSPAGRQGGSGRGRTGRGRGGPDRGGRVRDRPAGRGRKPRAEKSDVDKPPKGGNYRITKADALGAGGIKAKYAANVAAIKLLKQIESEKRPATPDEQAVLVKFVGWGGMPQAFRDATGKWGRQIAELKSLLTPDEYRRAKASITNAHYTSTEVIEAMWSGLADAGFAGGRVVEPGMGVGHFFGLMPESLRAASTLQGVELDDISGRIAKALYPRADIRIAGFETVAMPAGQADLVISNVPFAKVAMTDKHDRSLTALKAPIHDFYFSKALRGVRPGGLVAFITSRYGMDKVLGKFRKDWAGLADLVGAVRLPDTAFKGNANTDVVTDIIILQRRAEGALVGGEAFAKAAAVEVDGESVQVNEYFVRHPRHVLGRAALSGTMYGSNQYNVEAVEGQNLGEAIRQAIAGMPFDRQALGAKAHRTEDVVSQAATREASTELYQGQLAVEDGKLWQRQGEKMVEVEVPRGGSKTILARLRGWLRVRDAAQGLRRLQTDREASSEAVGKARKRLNTAYDSAVKKFGYFHSVYNQSILRAGGGIADSAALLSLENYDDDTKTADKADIFSRRTQFPVKTVTHAENGPDALAASLSERGEVDIAFMRRLTGFDEARLLEELDGLIYALPSDSGAFVTAAEYLSGNVRRKLTEAQEAAAADARFKPNVEALQAAQPADVPPGKISVRLGSPWIPASDYEAFVGEVLHHKVRVRHVEVTGTFAVDQLDYQTTATDTVDFGIIDMPAMDLLEKVLNHRPIKVTVPAGDGTRRTDPRLTAAAKGKADKIKSRFRKWVWENPERATRLARLYNDRFNSDVVPTFDGSHMAFPGMDARLVAELNEGQRPYRRDAVWRIVTQGNTLLAHAVGSGKTITMAAAVMEMRRLGKWKKPILVVPNHLIEQWPADFMQAYPSARILAATTDDFTPRRRATLMNRIATGDWDCIIIPETSFEKMPLSEERQRPFIQEQIDTLEDEIRAAKAEKNRNYEKELEKAKASLEQMLEKMSAGWKKDAGPYFDELGIDALLVDESHGYKNLWFKTKMGRVPGIATQQVQKSYDMWAKTAYINRLTGGRGIVFATGTPITNSLTEMYTLQRYLAPGGLEERGLGAFDAWANTFGESVTEAEFRPEGGGLRMHTRFRNFTNMPELTQAYRAFADVVTSEDLTLKRPELLTGKPQVVVVERSDELAGIVEGLVKRMDAIRGGKVDPSDDNALNVTTDGRYAAVDLRLFDPSLPDLPGSKINRAVSNILEIHKRTADARLTQVVWLDVGTPTGKARFNLYGDIKSKLVAQGVPAEEIAFVHDAKTDKQRYAMYGKVKTGRVRIIIGSTAKMGTGANIQKRLVAAHHIDAPWRPSDIEQRDGRILRFGNSNEAVEVFRYITKGSFDAYSWQTLEHKAGFIAQVARGDPMVREIEDVGGSAMSYAEVKAAAAEDPRLMDFVRLKAEVAQLQAEESEHVESQFNLARQIPAISQSRDRVKQQVTRLQTAAKAVADSQASAGESLGITIAGKPYTKHKAAGQAIAGVMNDARAQMATLDTEAAKLIAANYTKDGAPKADADSKAIARIREIRDIQNRLRQEHIDLGSLLGFRLVLSRVESAFVAGIEMPDGRWLFSTELGDDAVGNVKKIINTLGRVDEELAEARAALPRLDEQEQQARDRLGKPFDKADELAAKEEELSRLELELGGGGGDEPAAPELTIESVRAAFPGAKVEPYPNDAAWRVDLPGGKWFDVRQVDRIEIDWEKVEAEAGRSFSAKERAGLEAAGEFKLVTPDLASQTGFGLVTLAEGVADDATVRHEALHIAREVGMFKAGEWDALVREHSDESANDAEQEEAVAEARAAWEGDTGLAQRFRAWVRGLLDSLGLKDIDAKSVHVLMENSGFWSRRGDPSAGGGSRYQLRRRRGRLANPAVDEIARSLVNDVDELWEAAGEPPPRPDVEVDEAVQIRLAADYDAQKLRLLKTANEGGQLGDADTVAAKEIINREGVAAVQSGDPSRIDAAMALIHAYRKTGTEQARAFRQRRDPVETPAERRGRIITEALLTPPKAMLKELDQADAAGDADAAREIREEWAQEIEKIRAQLKKLGLDLDKLDEYTKDAATAAAIIRVIQTAKADGWDVLYEYWANAILSAPTTAAANIIGNVTHAGWALTAERFTEALVNTVLRRQDAATFGEFKYMLAGILPGMARGAGNFLKAWRSEVPAFEVSLGRPGSQKREEPNVAISGRFGRFVRAFGYRHLLAVDEFAKSLIAQVEVGARAYRIAKSEGLRGDAMRKRIAALTADLESEAWGQALDSAIDLAFQTPLGAAGKTMLAARREVPGLRYLVPFITTPGNIIKKGAQKSPLGSLKLASRVYRGIRKGDWAGITPLIAEQILAWSAVLALLGWMDDDEGEPQITGTVEGLRYRTRSMALRTAPPQSIRIGGRWYSYSRIEPFATTIGITVDWLRAMQRGEPAEMLSTPFESMVGQVRSKTFLSGLGDFLKALDAEEPTEKMARWAGSFVTSWVPNIVRSTGRSLDDTYSERGVWGDDEEWYARLAKRVAQKTELGIVDDMPKFDLWGRPAMRSTSPIASGPTTDFLYRAMVPVRNSEDRTFVGDQALRAWNDAHPGEEKRPMAPVKWWKDADGKKHFMDDRQYAQFARLAGRTAALLVEQEIADPANPTEQDIQTITKGISDARRMVRDVLRREWAGEQLASETAQELAGRIYERHLISKARRLSRAAPMMRSKREAWRQETAEARTWLRRRGVGRRDILRLYRRHLGRTVKTQSARDSQMRRLGLQLRRPAKKPAA